MIMFSDKEFYGQFSIKFYQFPVLNIFVPNWQQLKRIIDSKNVVRQVKLWYTVALGYELKVNGAYRFITPIFKITLQATLWGPTIHLCTYF